MDDARVAREVAALQMAQLQLQHIRVQIVGQCHRELLAQVLAELHLQATPDQLDAPQLARNAVMLGDALLRELGLLR